MTEPELNPYQSPTTTSMASWESAGADGQSRPAYKLYSVGSTLLATFLGSPVAGGVVMAINYKRLGRSTAAVHSLVWTTLATVVIVAVATMMPDNVHIPNGVFVVPQLILMYYLAKLLQGSTIELHQRHGGSLASAWGAVGISILCAVVVLGAIIGIGMLLPE